MLSGSKIHNTRLSNTPKAFKEAPETILRRFRSIDAAINVGSLSISDYKKSNRRLSDRMKVENIVDTEINAELWDRALVTAIGDISHNSYPHLSVIQKLINYTLNSHYIDIGLTTCFFFKLILFHPPNTHALENYYLSILNDKYLMLSFTHEEENNIFWSMIDILMVILTNKESLKGFRLNSRRKGFENNEQEAVELVLNLDIKKSGNSIDVISSPRKKPKTCFKQLPPEDQLERVLIVLEFLYNILAVDFTHKNEDNNCRSQSFLSSLLWEPTENVGLVNDRVKKLVDVWFAMEKANFCEFFPVQRKLLILLSNIIDNSDESIYIGHKADSIATLISEKFNDCLKENITAVKMLKPHWLRMLVCSKLLSRVTKNTCQPELTTVHDILEQVLKVRKGYVPNRQRFMTRKRSAEMKCDECNCMVNEGKRVKKARKSVDCYTSSTSLHEAVYNGHETCVLKLLKQENSYLGRKNSDGLTPLMCAVLGNQVEMCKLLLQHAGSELLTDVNAEGRTAMDLCQTKEIFSVLSSYQGIFIETAVYLCVLLVESYFITHRTWDLWIRRSRMRSKEEKARWDRARYEADVLENVDKLGGVVHNLMEFKDLRRCLLPLSTLLSLKKYL